MRPFLLVAIASSLLATPPAGAMPVIDTVNVEPGIARGSGITEPISAPSGTGMLQFSPSGPGQSSDASVWLDVRPYAAQIALGEATISAQVFFNSKDSNPAAPNPDGRLQFRWFGGNDGAVPNAGGDSAPLVTTGFQTLNFSLSDWEEFILTDVVIPVGTSFINVGFGSRFANQSSDAFADDLSIGVTVTPIPAPVPATLTAGIAISMLRRRR